MVFRKDLLIVLVYFSLGVTACVAEGEKKYNSLGTVPLLVSEHMKEVNCSPVSDFYANYMVTEPPFVWLDSSGFAFVCERENSGSETKYELVVKDDVKQNYFDSCPAKISLFAKPGGLKLENRMVQINDFVSIDKNNLLKSSPQKELSVLVLSTGTGGFIEYICVNGTWYFNTYS